MTSIAHQFLLLLTNLSQIKNKTQVIRIFTDAVSDIYPDMSIKWHNKVEKKLEKFIPVCTRKNTYGYFEVEDIREIEADNLPYLQNAIQLLAIFIEKIDHDRDLAKHSDQLKDVVEKQTADLLDKNDELANANQDLTQANKILIQTNRNLNREINRRIQAENERNKFEIENEIFKNALDQIPSYVYFKDIEGNYTYGNRHLLELFECTHEELKGKKDFHFFEEEGAKKLIEIDRKIIESLKSSSNEVTLIPKKGKKVFHFLEIKTPIIDKNTNQVLIICGISTDITQNKNTEIELENSRKMLRTIIDNIPVRVFWKDKQLNYLGCNKTFASDAGFENPEELIGKSDYDLPWGKMADAFRKDDFEVVNSKKTKINFEEPQLSANGILRHLRTNKVPLSDSEGKVLGILGTYEDISQLKLSEKELAVKVALLDIAAETARFGGWSVDIKSNKVIWSNVVCDIHEMPHGYLPTVEEGILFYAPQWRDKIAQIYTRCALKGIPYDEEMEIITAKGNKLWIRTTGKAVLNKKGKVEVVHGAFQDINSWKTIERELLKAKERAEESDRLKSAFLANMSHEIRTPMNSIMGFSSLLPEEDDLGRIASYTNIIVKNSEQLVRIIDDIVLYSRLQNRMLSFAPREFNLNELMTDVKQSFDLPEYKNKLELILEISNSQLVNVKTDYDKVRQILTNLISNAYKYTQQGYIKIGYTLSNNRVCCFVKDTGMGVPANEVEKVFERFYRASNVDVGQIGGTGLGLSIVKELIELIGGKIWIETREGKGTTFFFHI